MNLPEIVGKILVVDDDDDMSTTLSSSLNEAGYSAISAKNGEMALALLREQKTNPENPFVLVISDLQMPVLGGEQLLKHIRNDRELRSLGVIIMSGSIDQNGVQRLISMGVDGILLKPFSPESFYNEIRAALARKDTRELQTILKAAK